ncbi:type II toxin-antitoxin system VapC family toxin [Bosea sp. 685]|uniref:type II toxin-antitoxin system VapC family toxin n=1 Tax=Bosea sp. 685 TaxID=3080057 RepID=UPI002892BA30|nr:type II toxin-antitoxin system VapC family toxin [Bosea sp. 685]WNJ88437.1 type II toxin-antitoxin system VapC family toxin [Bosea sp. 685]
MPEPDGILLSARLGNNIPSRRFVSTVSIWEVACAVARLKNCDRRLGLRLVDDFAKAIEIAPVAPDMAITALAVEAAERYGMGGGRPGILNLGDCFSYATARHLKARLLFKGDDFSRTDIEAA